MTGRCTTLFYFASMLTLTSLGCQKSTDDRRSSADGELPPPELEVNTAYTSSSISKPCADHPGSGYHHEGSGACTGNLQVKVVLPTTDVQLVYNSLRQDYAFCLSKGWSLSVDQFVQKVGSNYNSMDGYGNVTSYADVANQSSLRATDLLASRNVFTKTTPFKEVEPDGTVFTYSKTAVQGGNFVTEISDRNGRKTTLTRNAASGCVTAVDFYTGQRLSLSYDAKRRLTKITDPAGKAYALAYDDGGNLSKITRPDSYAWVMTYVPGKSYLATLTDPERQKTAYAYLNGTGVLASVMSPANWVTSYSYSSTSVTVTDNQFVRRVETFASGRLVSVDDNGETTSWVRDADGRVASMTDLHGRKSSYYYAGSLAAGRGNAFPSRIVTSDGTETTITYDAAYNLVREFSKANGVVTQVDRSFDAFGELLSVESNGLKSEYARNKGNLTSVRDPFGQTIYKATYDAAGNITSYTDRFGLKTQLSWSKNRLASVTDHLGARTTFEWDALGNLSRTTAADGLVTAYTYDAVGRQLAETMSIGAASLGAKTVRSFYATGQPKSVETQQLVNGQVMTRRNEAFAEGGTNFRYVSRTVTAPGLPTVATDAVIGGIYGKVIQVSPTPAVIP